MTDNGDASGGHQGRLGNLELRILSAVVVGAAALLLTYLGGWPFRLLTVVVALAVFYEWTTITGRLAADRQHVILSWTLLAVVLVMLLTGTAAAPLFAVLILALVVSSVYAMLRDAGPWTTAGLAYAAVPAAALAFLRGSDWPGFVGVLFLFAVVWATDVFAYFVGRALRGPRLAPGISPGKTWSGAIGGAAAGTLAGLLVALFAGASVGLAAMALVALCLSVVAQLGDLFESAIKRRAEVKDSGSLIPGHGGVMDRVDGLVIAAFVFYLMGAMLSGADMPSRGFFLP